MQRVRDEESDRRESNDSRRGSGADPVREHKMAGGRREKRKVPRTFQVYKGSFSKNWVLSRMLSFPKVYKRIGRSGDVEVDNITLNA